MLLTVLTGIKGEERGKKRIKRRIKKRVAQGYRRSKSAAGVVVEADESIDPAAPRQR